MQGRNFRIFSKHNLPKNLILKAYMITIAMWFDADESVKSSMFDFIINGMGKNKSINFIIFTNRSNIFRLNNHNNIKIIEYKKSELIHNINLIFDCNIPLDITSREFGTNYICGFKPYIPVIFNEYFKDCEYYGWMDHEVILEENFDSMVFEYLVMHKNVFNLGNTKDSGHFQIVKNDILFKKYLYNNRFIYLNWFNHSANRQGVIRYFDDLSISPIDYLIGYIGIRDIFKKDQVSSSVSSIPNMMLVGSDYIRPEHPFTIEYRNGLFDRSSIEMIDCTDQSEEFRSNLLKSNIVWSLDKFFKDPIFNFDSNLSLLTFDS